MTPETNKKKAVEDQAKKELGSVNYAFTCLDQPRGWKGYLGKAMVNGTITAIVTITLTEMYQGYKRRHRLGAGPQRVVPMPNRPAAPNS